MGTMCDVHGLTWAIRAYGNEGFTWASNMGTMRDVHGLAWAMRTHRNVGFEWAILYGYHVWCAWSYMGHTGLWERGFYMGIQYGNHARCAWSCMGNANSQKRGFWMGHPVWGPRLMCMVLHGPYGLPGTRFLHGPSYMGTMWDVHGLAWAIWAHGNEGFKWVILYGYHVWCAWSYMGHTGLWERGFYMGIQYGNHERCAWSCMGNANSQKRGFWMGHPVWVPCVMCMVLHGPYGLMGTRVLHGHSIWEPCEMCMVLHGQCELTETWVLNGPSCMGTTCDVHGLK